MERQTGSEAGLPALHRTPAHFNELLQALMPPSLSLNLSIQHQTVEVRNYERQWPPSAVMIQEASTRDSSLFGVEIRKLSPGIE
jgi:hypothetical protein